MEMQGARDDETCGRGVAVPVGCSHEQAFRRDGEDLDIKGFGVGVQVLVVLHIVQTLFIYRVITEEWVTRISSICSGQP